MTLKKGIKITRMIFAIFALLITVASVVVSIVDGLNEWEIAVHPILTFLFLMLSGFGLLFLFSGFARRYPWHILIGSVIFFFALLYALIDVFTIKWWIILIVMIAYVFVAFSLTFIISGNKTEDIALNNHVEYKNYKQRREEKLKLEEEQQNVELPEIKSYKD